MASSRDNILNRLRAVKPPFEDAPPRPKHYQPVTVIEDTLPPALLERFTQELTRVSGNVHAVDGDTGVCVKVLELLRQHDADHILSWDFSCIPVEGLQAALEAAGIRITYPDLHAEGRDEHADVLKAAGAGLIGVDAAAASTGTLIVSTAPGKGRVPSVLPPVLIAIVALDQLVPRVESWLARERERGLTTILNSSNVAFITGPSRTADIEMQAILGVHGPGIVHVIVKQ